MRKCKNCIFWLDRDDNYGNCSFFKSQLITENGFGIDFHKMINVTTFAEFYCTNYENNRLKVDIQKATDGRIHNN